MGDGEQRIADLVGTALPDAILRGSDGGQHELAQLARDSLLLCFYPGDEDTGDVGGQADGADAQPPTSCEVHRAQLRDYSLDFAAFGVKIVAVSCEPHELQARRARVERLPYPLLSDGRCSLANALGLPTFEDLGARRYRRLSLLARSGTIAAVFYPVSPRRAAIQALAWLERSGIR